MNAYMRPGDIENDAVKPITGSSHDHESMITFPYAYYIHKQTNVTNYSYEYVVYG
jgi:hypothetical protein